MKARRMKEVVKLAGFRDDNRKILENINCLYDRKKKN